jgi:hypothetical protein
MAMAFSKFSWIVSIASRLSMHLCGFHGRDWDAGDLIATPRQTDSHKSEPVSALNFAEPATVKPLWAILAISSGRSAAPRRVISLE